MNTPQTVVVPDGGLGPVSGATLTRCRDCASTQLTITAQWHWADIVCESCHSAWRLQHGWLIRLPTGADPAAPPARARTGAAT